MANKNRTSTSGRPKKATSAARASRPGGTAGPPKREDPQAEPPSRAGEYLIPGGLAIVLVAVLAFYFKGRGATAPEPQSTHTESEMAPSGRSPTTPGAIRQAGSGSQEPSVAPVAPPPAPRAPEPEAQDVAVNPTHPDPSSPDPMHGEFTLTQATAGLPPGNRLVADIETSMGTFNCTLNPQQAPVTVANFVGLARGLRDFWDAVAGRWTRRPFFDGSVFHRVIPDFMIQGGDVLRSGRGGTGYTIRDENVTAHDQAGLLCMANRGPNTGSGQWFILEVPKPHLNGSYSVFGACTPTDLVGRIARMPRNGRDTPLTPIYISHVRIHR